VRADDQHVLVTLVSDVPPGTVLSDPVLPLLDLLVHLGIWAAVVLGLVWLRFVWWRERMIRKLAKEFPESADQLRRAAPAAPAPKVVPSDPKPPTNRGVVAPRGAASTRRFDCFVRC
jgi:hypothetical protein